MNSNDIFMRSTKPIVEYNGSVVNVNLSETEQNKKLQKGGAYSDNFVYIALSTEPGNKPPKHGKMPVYQTGGATSDTSEYFNRLANKIVNNVSTQKGGFNVKTTPSTNDSEFFLSSETINDINAVKVDQFGGAKKKTFDFDSLKQHIRKAVELSGGSDDDKDEDDDSEDKLFEDSDDEDEDEEDEDSDDEIIKEMHKSSEQPDDSDSVQISVVQPGPPMPAKKPLSMINKGDIARKVKRSSGSKKSRKSKKSRRSSKRSSKGKKHANDSESFSLDATTTEYQYSDSVSTPKLMAYRSVNKHNTITGSRYNK